MLLQDERVGQERDIEAIRAIVSQVQDAWNSCDGEAFAAPFAEDSDYVVVNGMHIKGRKANAEGHQRIFDTIYKGSTNTMLVENIRFIRPDVVIAHVLHHLKFSKGGQPAEGHARSTWVLTRNSGRWSVASFQNTAIDPHAVGSGSR